MLTMKMDGVFVTGTDTDVGKTQVASALAGVLQNKMNANRVELWKPAQTGVRVGDPDSDSYRLKMGSGLDQVESDVVSFTFPDPLAPWMAAQRSGDHIDYANLLAEGRARLERCDFLVAEGAGGLAVPLTEGKLMSDLAADLNLPLVIVARPGLGTVNHTLLTVFFARNAGLVVSGVIINGVKDTEDMNRLKENIMMIESFGRVPVIGSLPWFDSPQETADEGAWVSWRKQWQATFVQQVDLNVFI
jgi:dethiobiotin synthetase